MRGLKGYEIICIFLAVFVVGITLGSPPDSGQVECIVLSDPCKEGTKYPVGDSCEKYSECIRQGGGRKLALRKQRCNPHHIYDHEDEKCVDGTPENRKLCDANNRVICEDGTSTYPTYPPSPTTTTTTTTTTATTSSTITTPRPNSEQTTGPYNEGSGQSSSGTEPSKEPYTEWPEHETEPAGLASQLLTPTVLAIIIVVAGVIVVVVIIAVTVYCVRHNKKDDNKTANTSRTLQQSLSTNTVEAIYNEIPDRPPIPPPRPSLQSTPSTSSTTPILRSNSLYDAPDQLTNPNYQPQYLEVVPSASEGTEGAGAENPEYDYTYPRNPMSVLARLRSDLQEHETQAPPVGNGNV